MTYRDAEAEIMRLLGVDVEALGAKSKAHQYHVLFGGSPMIDPTLQDYNRPADHRPIDDHDGGARRAAITAKVCRIGGHPVTEEAYNTYSAAGQREYNMSGICEPCFDDQFAEPQDFNTRQWTEIANALTASGNRRLAERIAELFELSINPPIEDWQQTDRQVATWVVSDHANGSHAGKFIGYCNSCIGEHRKVDQIMKRSPNSWNGWDAD